MFIDGTAGGKKALCMTCSVETAHFSLSESCGLVGILCSIVEPFLLAMLNASKKFLFRRTITGQFVGDDHPRNIFPPFEQLAKKFLRGLFVAAALRPACQAHCRADPPLATGNAACTDREDNLVQMPCVPALGTLTAQFVGIGLPEFEAPLSYRTDVTTIPRCAISSSISRKLSEKRKYSQIA
jgi:hypothetical protein